MTRSIDITFKQAGGLRTIRFFGTETDIVVELVEFSLVTEKPVKALSFHLKPDMLRVLAGALA